MNNNKNYYFINYLIYSKKFKYLYFHLDNNSLESDKFIINDDINDKFDQYIFSNIIFNNNIINFYKNIIYTLDLNFYVKLFIKIINFYNNTNNTNTITTFKYINDNNLILIHGLNILKNIICKLYNNKNILVNQFNDS